MPATVFVGDIPEDTRRSDIEHFIEKSKYGRGTKVYPKNGLESCCSDFSKISNF